jgi:hypothetical protein
MLHSLRTRNLSYGNVRMVVYFDIINLVGNYMVVNELKSPYEKATLKISLMCMLKKKNLKSTQK